tara:strand:- start:69 stop:476 length:408 start_codon:yes stop_codon:yes gene_type:complete
VITFNYYYYYDNLENVKKLEDLKYFISFEDKGDYEYNLKDLKFFELHPETLEEEFPFLRFEERKEVLKDIEYFLTKVEEEINDEEGLFNSSASSKLFSSDIRVQDNSSSTKESYSKGEFKNKTVYQTKSSPDQEK